MSLGEDHFGGGPVPHPRDSEDHKGPACLSALKDAHYSGWRPSWPI